MMRKITKTNPPKDLCDWVIKNKGLSTFNYQGLSKQAKDALKQKLLIEQYYLCAYTGRQISDEVSHIEHLKPQEKCAYGSGEDIDYRNVVACFPAGGGDTSHGYGAPIKGSWWNEALFVSPLSEDCERRFSFAWSGRIRPEPEDHLAAKETIAHLGLDHSALDALRKAAINGFFGFGRRGGPISKKEAEILLRYIDKPDQSGKLRPFCFLLKQLLPKYLRANSGANKV